MNPDQDAARKMAAFDALPADVRRAAWYSAEEKSPDYLHRLGGSAYALDRLQARTHPYDLRPPAKARRR